MEVLYAAEGLTAAEVRERMPEPPGYSAVRALLRSSRTRATFVTRSAGRATSSRRWSRGPRRGKSALKALVQTFFDGSPEQAVAALIDESRSKLGAAELDRLAALIAEARKEGR